MQTMHPLTDSRSVRLRAANRRTALMLAALALAFFVAVIAAKAAGG